MGRNCWGEKHFTDIEWVKSSKWKLSPIIRALTWHFCNTAWSLAASWIYDKSLQIEGGLLLQLCSQLKCHVAIKSLRSWLKVQFAEIVNAVDEVLQHTAPRQRGIAFLVDSRKTVNSKISEKIRRDATHFNCILYAWRASWRWLSCSLRSCSLARMVKPITMVSLVSILALA